VTEKIKAFVHGRYFPLVLACLFFLIVEIFVLRFDIGFDDTYFKANKPFNKFMYDRYNYWSSRVLIESLFYFFARNEFLFRCIDFCVWCALVFTISYLFNNSKSVRVNWVLALLLILAPFQKNNHAGHMATALNYVWTLTAFFVCMIPIKLVIRGGGGTFCTSRILCRFYYLPQTASLFA
jgi:hypothetical protein